MPTYIKRNQQTEGPLTDAEIRQRLASGTITPQTPAWRMGLPEWKTVGKLFPGSPPPLPQPPAATPAMQIGEAMKLLDSLMPPFTPPPLQADWQQRLEAMVGRFLGLLKDRLGATARPNGTFYSQRVVTTAIQRIRLDMSKGATVTEAGQEFLALAAAYLASLAVENWRRRGLTVSGHAFFEPDSRYNRLYFTAERTRDGQQEIYRHDFLADMNQLLLAPPPQFPYVHGQVYMIESLTLPSPEYLYQYGVHLMQSPHSGGNWPRTQKVGGLPEDFEKSRHLLVDDLHADCGLPRGDDALRKLSWWTVFPPYGWQLNDASDYNFMTFFSQVSEHQVVPLKVATDYLRALLNCQSPDIRNFAARALMTYHVSPRNAGEASHYEQALEARDWAMARSSMAKYGYQMENMASAEEWIQRYEVEWSAWLKQTPPALSLRTAAENDPEYIELGKHQLSPEIVARFERLLQRYPNDWILRMIHASLLMQTPEAARGEAMLRELIQNPPDNCEGHSRLGTLLKRQGRLKDAMEVYLDEVRRWPWNHRAVDSCMWLVMEGMTRAK